MNFKLIVILLLGALLAVSGAHYRLPKSVIPSHYILEIFTNLEEPFEFNGTVSIKLKTIADKITNITINANELTVPLDKITLTQDDVSSIKIASLEPDTKNEMLVIQLSEPLDIGKNYVLNMSFSSTLKEDLIGFYRSKYILDGQPQWLAATQFEPTDARKAFPCFDEPAFKAKFRISLGHKAKYTAISNMPLLSREDLGNGWVMSNFKDTVNMSTYLVAMAVTDFVYKESPNSSNRTVFRTWARKNAIEQTSVAADVGPKFLRYYEEFFNISFPLPKVDQIALPDFGSGAMENWGLVTYRETALLFDANKSSNANLFRIAEVIAHELAHQWFGNLVTMKWWTDLWLNEGFATYMANRAVAHVIPEWNTFDQSNCDSAQTVFGLDSLLSSHPVSVKIGNPDEIPQIFDDISYEKGSFILYMMNSFLGESVFRQGLSNYLNKFAYQNAEQDDLWQSLTEEAHRQNRLPKSTTVKAIMDTWTLQTGYPLVTVTRDYSTGKAVAKQHRYLRHSKGDLRSSGLQCWWVPLTYTSGSRKEFEDVSPKAWLPCKNNISDEVILNDVGGKNDWLLFNTKQSGLYKVNYDLDNWNMIIDTLKSNYTDIPVLSRVQLIDNAFDLAETGNLPYDVTFRLSEYLKNEIEYLPLETALTQLSFFDKVMKRTPDYGLFEKYVRQLLTPVYEKVAYEIKDTSFTSIKRQVLISSWACVHNVGDCVAQSLEVFRRWRKSANPDVENPTPNDVKRVVYCTALRLGEENDWEFLWERYLRSNVGSDKITMLGALGCTQKVWLLNTLLERSIDANSGIRKQDLSFAFGAVARNVVGYYLAKDFMETRMKDIYEYLQPDTHRLARLLTSLTSQMTTSRELTDLKNFLKINAEYVAPAKLTADQVVEKLSFTVQWRQDYFKNITTWLKTSLALGSNKAA